jgi:hypothetical protein
LGIDLLGAPISNNPAFCDSLVSKRIDKIQLSLAALSKLDDPQAQLILLRACAAWPKFNFITRVCDPALIHNSISRMDDLVYNFLELDLVGASIPTNHRLLAHLPVSLGGIGLSLSSLTAPAAYLGSRLNSWSLCQSLIRHPLVDTAVKQRVRDLSYLPDAMKNLSVGDFERIPHLQGHFSARQCDAIGSSLEQSSNLFLRATLVSNKVGHASAWLFALPLPYASLTMEKEPFRGCLRRRLALPQLGHSRPCSDCKGVLDELGTHGAVCSISLAKHHVVSHALHGLLVQAGFKCLLEVSATTSIEDRGRPADILISNFSRGKDLAIDVTIATALQDLPATIADPLYAMTRAIQGKRNKYAGRLDDRTDFLVFPMDSSGGFHPSTSFLLHRLSSRLAHVLRVSRDEALSRVTQKLSFSLARVVGRGLVRA